MTNWTWKHFSELSLEELYAILALRQEVFAVEQNCAYQDADSMDQKAWHLCGWKDGKLAAYLRAFPCGIKYHEGSIGRVITAPSHRGTGLGRELTKVALEFINKDENFLLATKQPSVVPLRISAQAHLEKFYGEFGFQRDSEEYLEDGIPHIEMVITS